MADKKKKSKQQKTEKGFPVLRTAKEFVEGLRDKRKGTMHGTVGGAASPGGKAKAVVSAVKKGIPVATRIAKKGEALLREAIKPKKGNKFRIAQRKANEAKWKAEDARIDRNAKIFAGASAVAGGAVAGALHIATTPPSKKKKKKGKDKK